MQRVLPLILIGFGVFFLLGAVVVGWVVFPKLVEKKISSQVRLQEGSITWDKWRNITTPIFIKYYLFNVTNGDEILVGGKPMLEEKGPYVYEQKRLKTIVRIDEEKDTVTYQQAVTYFFRPDLSEGRSVDDVFTILNIPLAGFSTVPLAFRPLIDPFVRKNKETLFIQRTVDEFLFKGYPQHTVKDISEKLMDGKVLLPNNMFGLYYGKNGTNGVEFEVKRGVESSAEFGQIMKWDNNSQLNFWGGKYCNMINGTDGSIFAPFVTTDRTLRIFSEELCRSLYLTYREDIEHHGIPGYRFTLPKKLLERGVVNEDNKCFCENIGPKDAAAAAVEEETKPVDFDDDFGDFGDDEEEEAAKAEVAAVTTTTVSPVDIDGPKECRAGVILLSACRGGKPIVASTPHFLFGEPSDVRNIGGVMPIEAKHETFIDLEINTGLVLQASKKIQVNVQLKKTSTVFQMNKLSGDILLPILWADEYAAMPAERAEEFKDKLLGTFHIANVSKWSVIAVSLVLILVGLLVFVLRAKQSKYLP